MPGPTSVESPSPDLPGFDTPAGAAEFASDPGAESSGSPDPSHGHPTMSRPRPTATRRVRGPGSLNWLKNTNERSNRKKKKKKKTYCFELATDDWPFFYMQKRAYPFSYLIVIGILFGLSTLMVKHHLGMPQLLNAPTGMFFFLGAGFMLIETKAITELGLVFGNTWAVVAIVIGAILALAFLANQWILMRGPVNTTLAFGLLGLTLLLGLGVTRLQMAGVAIPLSKVCVPLSLLLPLFFAGLIFSSELSRGGELGGVLAANLFGAMLGGFLEYNSMYLGFSSLYPLGMALYGLAFVCLIRAKG